MSQIILEEQATPATPDANKVKVYAKAGGGLYTLDDAGAETDLAASGGSTLPVTDTTGIAKGSADATKVVRLEVDGLTTATTRVLTVQDKDITIADNADLHTQGTDTALGAVGTKNPPIDADKVLYRDSAAADVLVTSTWTQVKAFLKTYFDTLYNLYVHPNHTGAVTSVADGATTITDKAVTLAKMNDMATASLLGRNTAATGVPEVLSKATALSLLNVADGANAYVHPNHSGDVTSVADGAQTIAANAVTNAKAAQMATKTYKGRTSAATGNAEDVPVATLKTDLILVKADVSLGNVDNTSDATKNAATVTLTNKRITSRVTTIASSATPTPAGDDSDIFTVTALAEAAAFGAPTGTPVNGQKLTIRIKDNATARALSWNAIYRAGSDVALPTTTVISKTLYCGFIYNSASSTWDLVAVTNNI